MAPIKGPPDPVGIHPRQPFSFGRSASRGSAQPQEPRMDDEPPPLVANPLDNSLDGPGPAAVPTAGDFCLAPIRAPRHSRRPPMLAATPRMIEEADDDEPAASRLRGNLPASEPNRGLPSQKAAHMVSDQPGAEAIGRPANAAAASRVWRGGAPAVVPVLPPLSSVGTDGTPSDSFADSNLTARSSVSTAATGQPIQGASPVNSARGQRRRNKICDMHQTSRPAPASSTGALTPRTETYNELAGGAAELQLAPLPREQPRERPPCEQPRERQPREQSREKLQREQSRERRERECRSEDFLPKMTRSAAVQDAPAARRAVSQDPPRAGWLEPALRRVVREEIRVAMDEGFRLQKEQLQVLICRQELPLVRPGRGCGGVQTQVPAEEGLTVIEDTADVAEIAPAEPVMSAEHASEHNTGASSMGLDDELQIQKRWTVPHFFHDHLVSGATSTSISARIFDCMSRWQAWWMHLDEPASTGTLDNILQSQVFELINFLIIVLNTFYIALSVNNDMQRAQSGLPQQSEIGVINLIFLSYFSLELFLKVAARREWFIFGEQAGWNIFDSIVVIGSWCNIAFGAADVRFSFLRLIRCMKLARVLHALRFFESLRDLRMMMDSVVCTVTTLLFCLVMITFFMLLFALFFVQVSSEFVFQDPFGDQSQQIIVAFGSVGSAMRTLTMSTTGGFDWESIEIALKPVGLPATYVFWFFILFFQIAIWNVVTSTFIEKALRIAQPDPMAVLLDTYHQEKKDKAKLRSLFDKLDINRSGTITRHQFRKMQQMPEFRSFLLSLGLDLKEAETCFAMVCHSIDGQQRRELALDDIIAACFRIRGQASSVDLHILRYELKMLRQEMGKPTSKVDVVEAS